MTTMHDYNAQNLALVEDEIARMEADLRLLKEAVEQAKAADKPVDKVNIKWHLSNVAAKIREKRLLSDRRNHHILQISPRRYSVIKLSAVLGQSYCEFETIKANLDWTQAKLTTECANTRAE